MSGEILSENFLKALNLIVPSYQRKNLPEFHKITTHLENAYEKDAIFILTMIFQIPGASLKAVEYFTKTYKVPANSIFQSLPEYVLKRFVSLFSQFTKLGIGIFSKIVMTSSFQFPLPALDHLLLKLVEIGQFNQIQTVYHTIIARKPALIDILINNYKQGSPSDTALVMTLSSINCPKLPFESFCKVAGLLLSGRASIRSLLFDAFCFHATLTVTNSVIEASNPDDLIIQIFNMVQKTYPDFKSTVLNIIRETLGLYALPYITIYIFFNEFTPPEQKLAIKSLISKRASIKSFIIVSHNLHEPYLQEIYSIALSGKFALYEIVKKNINFLPEVLEKMTSVHFESEIIRKALEIAIYDDFRPLAFQLLKILGQHSHLARVSKAILKIFTTRQKKRILKLFKKFSETKNELLTSLYLVGTSRIISGEKMRTRYRSLAKAIVPNVGIPNIQGEMPEVITNVIKEKQTVEEVLAFFENVQLHENDFDESRAKSMIDSIEVPEQAPHKQKSPKRESPAKESLNLDDDDGDNEFYVSDHEFGTFRFKFSKDSFQESQSSNEAYSSEASEMFISDDELVQHIKHK